MLDLACSLVLVVVALAAAAAYGVRVAFRGPARNPRVEREGRSVLVGKGAMEMFQWALEPLGAACERFGVSANGVTLASVGLAIGAGTAIALGHPGVGALLAALSGSGDALDGIVARRTETTSEAGEVLDSSADRYSELAILGGLALALRESAPLLLLTLLAILASFMVSYSTAKAQALSLPAPRGSMRRSERAVYTILALALAPFAAQLGPQAARVPIACALALIAVVGNVSALQRLVSIARGAREREQARDQEPESRVIAVRKASASSSTGEAAAPDPRAKTGGSTP